MAYPTYAEACKLLKYDAHTGQLTWLPRPRDLFPTDNHWKTWNSRFAGKTAFTSIGGHGYRQGTMLGQVVLAHRIIWLLTAGRYPESIDHINGDRLDNRLENLREVSLAENNKNLRLRKNNTSGVAGVTWSKDAGKWQASISVAKRNKFLGFFEHLEDAAAARDAAKARYGFHELHGRPASPARTQ